MEEETVYIIRHEGRLNLNRRLAVEVTFLKSSLCDVLDAQIRQRIHYSASEVVRLEHDELVLDVLIACVHAKTLHEHGVRATVTDGLFDDNRALRIVGREPLAVLQVSYAEGDDKGNDKQIPVVEDLEHPLHDVEVRAIVVLVRVLIGRAVVVVTVILAVAVLTVAVLGIAVVGVVGDVIVIHDYLDSVVE